METRSSAWSGPLNFPVIFSPSGFSFKGEPREPFKEPLEALKNEVSIVTLEARRNWSLHADCAMPSVTDGI